PNPLPRGEGAKLAEIPKWLRFGILNSPSRGERGQNWLEI
ncbi:hypothetical protein HMPREF3156_00117, partial [Neisseria sp. HMSC06F02]